MPKAANDAELIRTHVRKRMRELLRHVGRADGSIKSQRRLKDSMAEWKEKKARAHRLVPIANRHLAA